MSSTSESITWQRWAKKWGDWTTWFPKGNEQREPSRRGLVVPGERHTENLRKGTSKDAIAHSRQL